MCVNHRERTYCSAPPLRPVKVSQQTLLALTNHWCHPAFIARKAWKVEIMPSVRATKSWYIHIIRCCFFTVFVNGLISSSVRPCIYQQILQTSVMLETFLESTSNEYVHGNCWRWNSMCIFPRWIEVLLSDFTYGLSQLLQTVRKLLWT